MPYNNSPKTFVAAAAITRGQRVKLDSTAGQVAVAGAGENGVGFADATVAISSPVPVRLDAPTSVAIASGSISFGDAVYSAAAGALTATASGQKVGLAITAGTDTNEFEVMPQTYAS